MPKVKKLNDDDLIAFINKKGVTCFKFIKNPSEKVIFAALEIDPYLIGHIPNPTEDMMLTAVSKNGHALLYIEKPTNKATLVAIKNYPEIIFSIKERTKEMQDLAFHLDYSVIGCFDVDDVTEDMMLLAVEKDVENILHIKNQQKMSF